MKKIILFTMFLVLTSSLTSCNNIKDATTEPLPVTTIEEEKTIEEVKEIIEPTEPAQVDESKLEEKINKIIETAVAKEKLAIRSEAITAIWDTKELLQLIESGEKEKAIEKWHKLIGKFKVLLLKEPSLQTIIINSSFEKNILVSDIETIKKVVSLAKIELDNRHYQDASALLNKVKSEIIIKNILIPTVSYPEGIKVAIALLKDGDKEWAKVMLQKTLGSLIIEKKFIPIPVLKAEQLMLAAAKIKSDNEEYSSIVTNLINHAHFQLYLAQEMWYGKKNEDYNSLYVTLNNLKDSVISGKIKSEDLQLSAEDIRKLYESKFSTK